MAERHAANLAGGLLPADDPLVLAELCGSCHSGTAPENEMTHEMMAAGHKELTFDLDVLAEKQRHWIADEDYVARRKRISTPREIRLIGRGERAAGVLAGLARHLERDPTTRAWPELGYFDCDACHRTVTSLRPHAGPVLPVGAIPPDTRALNDFVRGFTEIDRDDARVIEDRNDALVASILARTPQASRLSAELTATVRGHLARLAPPHD